MITLRRTRQRYDGERDEPQAWLTFCAHAADDVLVEGFGGLELLTEIRLPPSGTIGISGERDAETITYVLSGSLAYQDSLGRSGALQAGDFRRVTTPRGTHGSETNACRGDWTHLFHIGLRASATDPASEEQKRFSTADRRGRLCLIAAADPSAGALRLRENAFVYSALLHSGQHLVHKLLPERRSWLQVVSGAIRLYDFFLAEGDGAGVAAERSVSFTARAEAEILLIDVA